MDANSFIGCGRVEDAPSISTPGGKKQAYFILGINEKRQDSNKAWVDNIIRVPIVALEGQADVVERYVVPGHEVIVQGSLITWTDESGAIRFCVKAFRISLGMKPKGSTPNAQSGPNIPGL